MHCTVDIQADINVNRGMLLILESCKYPIADLCYGLVIVVSEDIAMISVFISFDTYRLLGFSV